MLPDVSYPGYFKAGLVGDVEHACQASLSGAALAFVLGIAVKPLSQAINQSLLLEGGLC
jgi:hypothetical protein